LLLCSTGKGKFSAYNKPFHSFRKEDVMKSPQRNLSRRHFLLAVGAGGAAATAAVVATRHSTSGQKKAEAVTGSKGYHVTEHIRKYYDTTKV
jgi:hypothetical protein